MKLSITSKMMLFLSSYSLLFVALTFKYKFDNFTWIFIVLAVLGGIATIKITKTKINPDNREVINIVSKNDQVLNYLVVSYLLPFIGFDLTQSNEFVALIILPYMLNSKGQTFFQVYQQKQLTAGEGDL